MFPIVLSRVSVDLAAPADLELLIADIPSERWHATIYEWLPIRITQGKLSQVHLLGRLEEPAYITSAVVGIDAEHRRVRTRSGSIYNLEQPGEVPEMLITTAWHLRNALVHWRLTTPDEIDPIINSHP